MILKAEAPLSMNNFTAKHLIECNMKPVYLSELGTFLVVGKQVMTSTEDHDSYYSDEDIFIAVLNFTLIVGIIIINGFILVVVICKWQLIRRVCNNRSAVLMTINLCATDLTVGFLEIYFNLPLYVPSIAEYLDQHKLACTLRFTLIIGGNFNSSGTLLALAVERYIYVVHALRYAELMNSRRAIGAIIFILVTSIVPTLPIHFWNGWENGSGQCNEMEIIPQWIIIYNVSRNFTTMIVITGLHWRIHREALKIHRRHERGDLSSPLQTRSARVVFIILIVYLVSWLPFTVALICRKIGIYVWPPLHKFCSSIVSINYVVNPFVYAYNHRSIGAAITSTLHVFDKKFKSLCGNVVIRGANSISGTMSGDIRAISKSTTSTVL